MTEGQCKWGRVLWATSLAMMGCGELTTEPDRDSALPFHWIKADKPANEGMDAGKSDPVDGPAASDAAGGGDGDGDAVGDPPAGDSGTDPVDAGDGGNAILECPDDCDDGVECTADSCDESTGNCVNAPRNSECDDGEFCNGAERCDAVDGCVDVPLLWGDGGDGVGCTDDSCDEDDDVVVHTPNDSNCDNGLFCDGTEQCHPTNGCQRSARPCTGNTPICDEAAESCTMGHVLVGAGDIADRADLAPAEYTADLVSSILASEANVTVFTLGDNVYPAGTAENFANYYESTWGVFKSYTRPIAGNHDYGYGTDGYGGYDSNGLAYVEYFDGRFLYDNGGGRGPDGTDPLPDGGLPDPLTTATEGSYYSYEIGANWHVVVIDSQCTKHKDGFWGCRYSGVGSSENSVQAEWLVADLDNNTRPCVVVMWHHPRWSSGRHGDNDAWVRSGGNSAMEDMWRILTDKNVDLLLSGHDHHYERFHRLDGLGLINSGGVRQFVVGTGGRYLYAGIATRPITAVFDNTNFGVLKLLLLEDSYRWQFIGGGSKRGDPATVLDSGSTDCH